MVNRLAQFLCLLVLGAGLASSAVLAQDPKYLPEEIPLDVEEIYTVLEPADDYSDITRGIIRQLKQNHYADIVFNDAFSSDMLDSYLKSLDGSRIYFTAEDIEEFGRYRTELDDRLQEGNLSAGYLIYNRYQRSLIERLVYSIRMLEEEQVEFDFTKDESIAVDREEASWAASEAELRDLWRKRVKSSALSLKLEDNTMAEIREQLSERYRSQLSQVLKTKGRDVYQRYMDAMTMTFDPHTQYYAPRAAENFNMNMRLSLEGIGAVLTTENEYTEVVSIVSGGPADMGGELQPNDRVVGVAQGDGEFTDVVGWRVDDVVQLIRGEKGTVVRLKVIPSDAENNMETNVISITRDTVKLEEQSAQKEIVEVQRDGQTYKVGVIELPTFYIDFEALQNRDPDYRSSTRDVRRLLEELKAENVDGVVVDLRSNGGGSLSEANSLVGLFIRRGPTVQVRDAEGNNIVQGDPDPEVVYEGPLAVLVNGLSASASEIFAGAIQDYNRGLVLGSQTFGKGTVQELVPMDQGQMKITRAKFYRISGESTQLRGIAPDITFPDLLNTANDIGESALPHALPWDTIEANYYRTYANLDDVLPDLRQRHQNRIDSDPDFNYIRAQIHRAEENESDNTLTLNEESLRAEREGNDQWRLRIENERREAKGKDPFESIEELEEEGESNLVNTVNETGIDPPQEGEDVEQDSDPYVIESGQILLDLIELQESDQVTFAIE